MKSYIKIQGPPLLKSIKALEKIAVDLPEVCIMDSLIQTYAHAVVNRSLSPKEYNSDTSKAYAQTMTEESWPLQLDAAAAKKYFEGENIPFERCSKMISKSGDKVGEYDFYFEWTKRPTSDQLSDLINRIDKALAPLGCRYTITTK
jgi:hypothetical protein